MIDSDLVHFTLPVLGWLAYSGGVQSGNDCTQTSDRFSG
jgi:hypothetical protein